MSAVTSPETTEAAARLPAAPQDGAAGTRSGHGGKRRRPSRPRKAAVPPKPLALVLSMALTMVAAVITLQLVNIIIVSPLQHAMAQTRLYEQLRLTLSEGSAPLGQTDYEGNLVAPGTPVALLSVPGLNIREVIVEGTAAPQTMEGVGHRRDTPLPGQPGTSVLMGRSGAFGGVFRDLALAPAGAKFTVITGQGTATYEVTGQRRAGDTAPPTPTGTQGRLTLTTADGPAFLPNDVLRVDAKLVSKAFDRPAPVILPGSLPAAEQAMGVDTSELFMLVLLLQLLILASLAAVWSWTRWGKGETWLVFAPVLGAVALLAGTQINHLLPNLL
ncbi:sortase [Arthrobacter sp. NPDC058097]|uniref:sortase n=1 Tax=Arthrobacter sp. NPDC058097 TaxID=3346340 RepID=UPI0036D83F6F